MFNRNIRMISLVLSLVIIVSPLYGCSVRQEKSKEDVESEILTEITELYESVISDQLTQTYDDDVPLSSSDAIVKSALDVLDNDEESEENTNPDYSSYVGDMDVFVYGLLIDRVLVDYDCFCADIILEDGRTMSGIAYTDYANCFETVTDNPEDEVDYISVGFVPFMDEPVRYSNVAENLEGIEVINTDYQDDHIAYFLGYQTDPFKDHCVIWNQYLTYGIDDNGDLFYSSKPYNGDYDQTVGTLYSFDEHESIYIGPYNNNFCLTGESLAAPIDYAELSQRISELEAQQTAMLTHSDLVTYANLSQERVNMFLLSQQAETFMGYKVSDLLEINKGLDPTQCMRITPHGLEIDALQQEMPEEPAALLKWLVGINCAVAVVGAFVVPAFVPALKPVCDAVAGLSIELCLQVIAENKTLKDVNWGKVAVAAVAGAVFSIAGSVKSIPLRMGANAMIGGTVSAMYSYLDDKEPKEIMDAFVLGAVVAAGVTLLSEGVVVVASKVGKAIVSKSEFLTNLSDDVTKFISNHQVVLFKDANGDPTKLEKFLNPRYKYAIDKAVENNSRLASINGDTLEEQIRLANVKDVTYKTTNGDIISKRDAFTMKEASIFVDETTQPEIANELRALTGSNNLMVKNGKFDFDPLSLYEVKLTITDNRDVNFSNVIKRLRSDYSSNPNAFSDDFMKKINEYLAMNNMNITSFNVSDLNSLGYTIHEEAGRALIIPTNIHEFFRHSGGVSYAKKLAEFMFDTNAFDEFAVTVPASVYGTYAFAA